MNAYLTFKDKSEIKSEYLGSTMYNLLDKTFEIPSVFKFDVIKVSNQYIARPDLLSYDLFGTDMYADVICKVNGISNPFELNEGDLLVVPSTQELSRFFVKPIILEQNNTINSPVAKPVQSKRKPNEAVIGDKRFTIDKQKRVIIY